MVAPTSLDVLCPDISSARITYYITILNSAIISQIRDSAERYV